MVNPARTSHQRPPQRSTSADEPCLVGNLSYGWKPVDCSERLGDRRVPGSPQRQRPSRRSHQSWVGGPDRIGGTRSCHCCHKNSGSVDATVSCAPAALVTSPSSTAATLVRVAAGIG